jgi:type II secretory pathway component PulF
MLTNIVDINEGTDCLALFLDTVGDIYKGYMDATITRLTSLLEAIPIMVLPFIPRDVVLCAMVPIFQHGSIPCGLFEP